MLSHGESKKAQRYLSLLDEARCSANWDEVSRLRLKIAKHLPERKCLQDTVATEYVLSTQFPERPSTSSSLSPFDYGERIPVLLTALKYGNPTAEDTFQAEVCLAWLHWTINEPTLALSRLPSDVAHAQDRLMQTEKTLSGWTHVCIVKGGYLRGICQENTGDLSGAAVTYKSMLPYMSKAENLPHTLGEHRVWIQRLLARYCLLQYRLMKLQSPSLLEPIPSSSPIAFTSVLTPFRAWAEFWKTSSHQPPKVTKFSSDRGDVSQRLVWHAYYDTISIFVRIRSLYAPSSKGAQNSELQADKYDINFFSEPRSQQCMELKQVQSIYESFLINELSFPKANEATPEIELWVDQVVDNWKIICGPTWRNEDHIGGKEVTTRVVLEILYRASMRSFHSTRILRHLFIVHNSLAEFDLGRKALDTYFDIFTQGKARAEKSGKLELDVDDDATAIHTAATGIRFLCLHGRWEEGKKSRELGVMLEEWLHEHYKVPASSTGEEEGKFPNVSNGEHDASRNRLSPKVLAAGFCALGISQAHWANLTCEISERTAFQARALSNFRIASSFQVGHQTDTDILYAFALTLSRNRQIDSAVGVIKRALSNEEINSVEGDFTSEIRVDERQLLNAIKRRQMLKSWHLLALLLSAKQNFSTAMASCDAALELFGLGSTTSDRSLGGFVPEKLEFSDRESIIEISMTRLALAEVLDGPEDALSHFRDLFILFGKLFNDSDKPRVPRAKDVAFAQVSPPSSRNGTIESFRSSFLGRSRDGNRKEAGTNVMTRSPVTSSVESFSGVTQKPPAISVTAEDGPAYQGTPRRSHHLFHLESKKLHKRNSKKSVTSARRNPAVNVADMSTANGIQSNLDVPVQNDQDCGPSETWPDDDLGPVGQGLAAEEVGIAISYDSPPLSRPPTTAPILTSTATSPGQHSSSREPSHLSSFQASQQSQQLDVLFSETVPPPSPFFPATTQARRSLTLLTRIWLQVAALYRRAMMPADAHGAVSEAMAQVSAIESLVTLKHSSAEILSTPDFGGVPSVSELWAEAFSERARLHEFLGERDVAEADYETALTHSPDHSGAIVGLSHILLESYSQTGPDPSTHSPLSSPNPPPLLAPILPKSTSSSFPVKISKPADESDDTLLPRLSARDRAAGLLSSLTKSSQGWDCAEAWFALARAYELRGQIDKAKEALWWVVELEEARPVRGWGCLQW